MWAGLVYTQNEILVEGYNGYMGLGHYFYLWGVLLIVPIWLYIFISRRRSRQEMVYMGLLFGLAAAVIARVYALSDYWNPPYLFGSAFNVEDFLYGFFYGGIATELYEAIISREDSDRKSAKHYWLLALLFLVTLLSFIVLVDIFHFNSILAHIVPPIVAGVCTAMLRQDLIGKAVLSGFALVIFTTAWYSVLLWIFPHAIEQSWRLENLSGVLLLDIPLEEYIFAFSLGFGGSFFYEAVTGRRLRKLVR